MTARRILPFPKLNHNLKIKYNKKRKKDCNIILNIEAGYQKTTNRFNPTGLPKKVVRIYWLVYAPGLFPRLKSKIRQICTKPHMNLIYLLNYYLFNCNAGLGTNAIKHSVKSTISPNKQ